MTRATQFATYAGISTIIYILLYLQIIPIPFLEQQTAEHILTVLPWWLLVTFGSYSLGSLGWGLFTFRDCPEAYTELLSEINQAKIELRAKGISVD